MAKYSKFNMVYRLQKWMDSVAGQTFMNYAYSWGASIVILGTLFKLTHLPGANVMLFIGMGTEVFVFFISAFDRPFDKTADGRDLATDSELAAQLAQEQALLQNGVQPQVVAGGAVVAGNVVAGGNTAEGEGYAPAGGTIIIGGGAPANGGVQFVGGSAPVSQVATNAGSAAASVESEKSASQTVEEGGTVIMGQEMVPQFDGGEATKAPESVPGYQGTALQIGTPAPAVTPETAQAMEEATSTYVDRLNELNELLLKIGAVSERLSVDSQEMENLNRTLTGIARVYEMQLKSASLQINTQDEINEQTRKMASQIQELNSIYARMIEAMTTNMPK